MRTEHRRAASPRWPLEAQQLPRAPAPEGLPRARPIRPHSGRCLRAPNLLADRSEPGDVTQPPRRDPTHRKLGWTLDEARLLAGVEDHRLYALFHPVLVTGMLGDLLGL